MKPYVGQTVLAPADPNVNNGANTAPAVVTRVWSDTCVNLRILLDGAGVLWKTSSVYRDSLEDVPAGAPYWTYLPEPTA